MLQKYKSLDILKGIAIIMILITHNRHFIMKDMSGARQLINYCQMGCQIFFVVSGISLCISWFKHNDLNFGKHTFNFIKRRYIRILPGFLIMLALNFFLNVITIDIFGHYSGYVMNRKAAALITNALLLHGLSPEYINTVFPGGWYIGTSILLYWLFPFLVSLFSIVHKRFKPGIYFIPVIFFILNCLILNLLGTYSDGELAVTNNSFLYFLFTNQLPCFSFGILLYFQEKDGFSQKCPILLSVLFFTITLVMSYKLYISAQPGFSYALLPTLSGFSFYMLTVVFFHIEYNKNGFRKAAQSLTLLPRIFTSFIACCGIHSYGMYLTHSLISWYAIRELRYILDRYVPDYNDFAMFLLLFPITVILVYMMGFFLEKLLKKLIG